MFKENRKMGLIFYLIGSVCFVLGSLALIMGVE